MSPEQANSIDNPTPVEPPAPAPAPVAPPPPPAPPPAPTPPPPPAAPTYTPPPAPVPMPAPAPAAGPSPDASAASALAAEFRKLPGVVPDVIKGGTVAEVQASLDAAKKAYEAVKVAPDEAICGVWEGTGVGTVAAVL